VAVCDGVTVGVAVLDDENDLDTVTVAVEVAVTEGVTEGVARAEAVVV
jgi:hypothetical protein